MSQPQQRSFMEWMGARGSQWRSQCPASLHGHGGRHSPLARTCWGRMGCVFAHVLLTPLLKEQIQRYFILCTFV